MANGLRRKHFYTILLATAVLVSIIVVMLSIIMYTSYKRYSIDLLADTNESYMKQIVHNTEQFNNHVRSYALSLFASLETTSLMLDGQQEIRYILNDMNAVSKSLAGNPFVESAYIYNESRNAFYLFELNNLIRYESIYDAEAAEMMRDPDGNPYPIARQKPVSESNQEQIEVMSYVIREYQQQGSRLKLALMLNVDPGQFMHSLVNQAEEPGKLQNSFFVDSSGRVQAHGGGAEFLTDLSAEPYMQRLLAERKTSGNFITDIQGQTVIVTYVRANALNWTFVNLVPYTYIQEQMGTVQRLTMWVGLLTLALGLLAAYYISKQLYSPIKRISHKLKPPADDRRKLRDEFELILDTFRETEQKSAQLEQFKISHLRQIQQKLLLDLLCGRLSEQQVKAQSADIPLALDIAAPVRLILLRIDDYAGFQERYADVERSLLKYAMGNIAIETFRSTTVCEMVDPGDDHLVLLLNSPRVGVETDEAFASEWLDLIAQTQRHTKRYLDLSISCAISSTVLSFPHAYQQVVELADYRLEYGKGCIVNEAMVGFRRQAVVLHSEQVEKLLVALREGKIAQANNQLEAIWAELQGSSYDSRMMMIKYVATVIFQTMMTMEQNKAIRFEPTFAEFERELSRRETMDEVDDMFRQLLSAIDMELERTRDEKTLIMVKNVMIHIEQNYANPELSAVMLADLYGITPSYLNKLFRIHASQSTAEYLMTVRMERARQMLEQTNFTIDEIVKDIGWENRKYFFTVFKRLFGATPNEYRRKQNFDAN